MSPVRLPNKSGGEVKHHSPSGDEGQKRHSNIGTQPQYRDNSLVRGSFVTAVAASVSTTQAGGGVAVTKPGSEVLSLISIWIRNAPNDFMGRIIF